MVDSWIEAVDALDNVALDLSSASDALCFQATIDGNDLASMVSRVLDADLDAVREVAKWLEANAEKPNDV